MKTDIKFKHQKTPYTCQAASLAVITNSLLDTDYSEFDIIKESDNGLPLQCNTLHIPLEDESLSKQRSNLIKDNWSKIRWGTFHSLMKEQKLPENIDECLDIYLNVENKSIEENIEKLEKIHL